ncbi:MAG: hypothetical protein H8E17_19445 [Deltaproteobacteria bacterium]|nr:hypothetical protein [Deltaproteobacteria bacterium]
MAIAVFQVGAGRVEKRRKNTVDPQKVKDSTAWQKIAVGNEEKTAFKKIWMITLQHPE